MPIQRCKLPGGGHGYRYGRHGKCYRTRKSAVKQAQAIHASGWHESLQVTEDSHAYSLADEQFRRLIHGKRFDEAKKRLIELGVDPKKADEMVRPFMGESLAFLRELVHVSTLLACELYEDFVHDVLKKIPQQKQRQDATNDQLKDLRLVANKLGMYDAADVLRTMLVKAGEFAEAQELTETKWITDLGQSHDAVMTRSDGKEETLHIHRYGVWAEEPFRKKAQVIDTGDDLEALRKKHNVTTDVVVIGKKR